MSAVLMWRSNGYGRPQPKATVATARPKRVEAKARKWCEVRGSLELKSLLDKVAKINGLKKYELEVQCEGDV